MEKINYQRMLEKEIAKISADGEKKRLLLHACCAPCSSYVLEYLSDLFDITLFYCNPNITSEKEYRFRINEVQRFLTESGLDARVKFQEGRYDPASFFRMAKGLEDLSEGGERCFRCYELRLRETAAYAAAQGFDYFTTTLSISPHKNAEKLNCIGKDLSAEYGVPYLFSDFKKRNGYKRSVELSEQYHLYRQNYCGCIYSYNEMKRRTEHDVQQA